MTHDLCPRSAAPRRPTDLNIRVRLRSAYLTALRTSDEAGADTRRFVWHVEAALRARYGGAQVRVTAVADAEADLDATVWAENDIKEAGSVAFTIRETVISGLREAASERRQ